MSWRHTLHIKIWRYWRWSRIYWIYYTTHIYYTTIWYNYDATIWCNYDAVCLCFYDSLYGSLPSSFSRVAASKATALGISKQHCCVARRITGSSHFKYSKPQKAEKMMTISNWSLLDTFSTCHFVFFWADLTRYNLWCDRQGTRERQGGQNWRSRGCLTLDVVADAS